MVAALATPRQLTLVTPEHEPLSAFGAPAAELDARHAASGRRRAARRRARDACRSRRVVAARARRQADVRPRRAPPALLAGRTARGVPCDAHGFILVDDAFRVREDDDVFAVGDATAGPYKQGGLAAQQADVVAEHIAWQRGRRAPPAPVPSRPAGTPAHGRRARYLRAEPPGRRDVGEVSDQCLWWPAEQGRRALADAVARGARAPGAPGADAAQAADRRHQLRAGAERLP